MASTLFILNDAPYGNARRYNALRLAAQSADWRIEADKVLVF